MHFCLVGRNYGCLDIFIFVLLCGIDQVLVRYAEVLVFVLLYRNAGALACHADILVFVLLYRGDILVFLQSYRVVHILPSL
jgi:hypothetical protein